MEKEKYLNQKTENSSNNIDNNSSKDSHSQNNNIDLKRFNSHEVYLVTQKKPQNNDNIKSTKGNKKIYLNISKTNQDKIKPQSKRSFNTNSNVKEVKTETNKSNKNITIKTENNVFNKSKTKVTISPTNYMNSIRKTENIIKASKILDEESIKEIDSEGENTSSNKGKNYNENNKKEKESLISNSNRIIKKINFDDIQTNNAQMDSKDRELLLISKKGDKEKLLELLSSKQVNINFQNENGWSALHFACDEGNLKIVDILIKSKINLNLKTNEKKTALHISVLRGYFDISKLLLENGAKINLRDNEQNLPIHICASQGHDELLNFLLEKNSSGIKVKNLYGKTPLDLANKETTKEIIKKFLDIKKKNINDKAENFSRIKIRKTNKDLMKCLMTPISSNVLSNNDINSNNNTLKKSTINKLNNDTNTNSTLTSSSAKPFNTKEKISTSSKKIFAVKNNNSKQNKKNKLKIEISSSNKTSIFYRKHLSNKNNALKDISNTNTNTNNNNTENKNIINNNNKYLNTTSNKHKTIFNIHISCNNNGNKSPSPYRDSNFHYNTSSNMTSSSKQIHNNNNNKVNNESKGNEIFFGDKEKKKGKIINIPKRLKNKKEDRSQSKNKKMTSVWKTVTQTDRITPKFSPNIKYMEKYKKKNLVFKKEDSKFMNSNNLSSKRTVSVPRFLDTEYILEPQNKKQQFKREESTKNKFKVPKKNKEINISNQNNIKNKNKESINSFKGKIMSNSNPNNKNMKKHISDKNNKQENLGIKNSQIYTEDGANLIDDLDEEETIIELPKHNEKNKKESLVKNNKEISNNKNSIKISINIPNQEIKRSQNMTIENDENDDLEELEDSFYSSEESDSNKNEKIGPSNFVCLALLGQGSFGEVYLVKKKDSDDFYAMKVLDKCRIAKQNIFKYVLTERNILSVMHNPFIVRLNYAFQTSEKLFLLLDYCPGGDLSKQLQIQTRFSEEKAKFYICEIILALGELHKNNIIFRDLKPDNIVIDKEGHALLTDFGLSREGIIGKDVAKSFCGSIAYLAPEMLSRTGHGKGVDWYLLGVLFYELLVGVPPYFTTNQEQIFRNIQNAQLYIPPFVSNKAANLIKSLLKRNPNERLGSKRDVEEIKEHEYFADVDWQKVYERKYKPPQIYLKSNHLQFFRQPLQFKENEEDDLFVKDSNYNNNDYNKYNQDILNSVNNYEGWSFVQKQSSEINNNVNSKGNK